MKKLLLALALLCASSSAWAQCTGVFPASNVCGTTAAGSNVPGPLPLSSFALAPGGTSGQYQTNNGSGGLAGATFSGDCTATSLGVITCTKTNGVAFGSLATASSVSLAQGGLGGSQAAATVNQIPVFPGSAGAAAPTSGSTWFDNVYCNTIGYLIVRFTSTWTCDNSIPASVKWWGATGNGVTDDTTNVQAAITAVQAVGGTVYIPKGSYKITAQLNVTNRLKISGDGFQGDSGGGFAGHGVSQSTGFLSSTLVCATTINCIVATTNNSVQIQDIQITYPSTPSLGTSGITIQAVAGAGNANTQSTIHHTMITGANVGISLTNCLDYRITNNDILYNVTYGIVTNSPNFPSFNQSSISDNEIWGAGNAGFQAHIIVQAGGDLRITNNKLTTGGVNTNGIAFVGASSGAQSMEPLVVTGNTIEGAANCIAFSTANASFTASQIAITGNQMWCGSRTILVSTFGTSQYVLAMTITGNSLTVNGGASVANLQVDNVKNAVIVGNVFGCSGGCSTSTGITLGANTTGMNVQANSYDVGYTTKVNNIAGAANSVGVATP